MGKGGLILEPDKNRHHKIPRSKGGLTNDINVQLVDVLEHSRRHSRCGNDTPVEAICRVLLRNEGVRNENFKADLMNVLDNYLNNYYAKKTHSGFIKSEVQKVMSIENDV